MTTMSLQIEDILTQLAACPLRATIDAPVPTISRATGYRGRHHMAKRTSIVVMAARRIVVETDRVDAFLTGQTFHGISAKVATTWRTMDRAAYGAIPATWRHRLEARARTRAAAAQQRDDTEAWWISRSADYPVLIPTQAMPIVEEKTRA